MYENKENDIWPEKYHGKALRKIRGIENFSEKYGQKSEKGSCLCLDIWKGEQAPYLYFQRKSLRSYENTYENTSSGDFYSRYLTIEQMFGIIFLSLH